MRASPLIRSVVGQVLRFLLPWACAGCRIPLETIEDSGFCGPCWLMIPRIQGCICRFCGLPLKDGGNLCFPCRQDPPSIMIRAATSYLGPVPKAVHRFKYAGRKTLGRLFGILLERAWENYPELRPVDALIPVPLHPASLRERSYNQASILADMIAPPLRQPVLQPSLIRVRKTKPQFRLQKAERLTNVREAFGLSPALIPGSLKGLHLLLIDDVCTTGATLKACSRVLKRAGAASVKALVLARDI